MNYMERLRKFSVTFFLALGLILCVNVMDVTALAAGETAVTTSAGASTASEEADDAESSTATGDGSGQTSGSGSSVGTQPPASHAASSGDTNNNGTGGSTGGANTIGDGGDSSDDANTNGDGSGSSDDANTDGDGSGSSDNANASGDGSGSSDGANTNGDGSGSSDNANASGDGSDLSDDTNTNEGDTLPPQTSQAVQQLLDIVSELPDAVSWDDADTLLAQIAACQTIYDSLTADEQARVDVAAALAQLQALKAKVDSVTTTRTEGSYTFTLHRDCTAAVTKYTISSTWDGSVEIPDEVTFDEAAYRVTAIGYNAFSALNGQYAKLTLPDTLETIGDYAFNGVRLYGGELVIPDSVISIGKQAFCYFHNDATEDYHVDKIVLGSGVKNVGNFAFWSNGKASDFPVKVEFKAPVESFATNAFNPKLNTVSKITVNGYKYSMNFSSLTMLDPENIEFMLGLDHSHAYSVDNLKEIITEVANSETKTQTIAIAEKRLYVSESIVIPDGVTITLTNDSQMSCAIETSSSFRGPVFLIDSGGTLIIAATTEQGLIVNGKNRADLPEGEASVFQVNGMLVLENGKIYDGNRIGKTQGMSSGAIVLGDSARFLMTGGAIGGATASGESSGTIVLGNSAQFTMTGGTISGTTADGKSSGTIVLGNSAQFTMTGGSISGTTANKNYSGAIVLGDNARFNMSGGTISGTTANGTYGGAIVLGNGTQFTMTGGSISGTTIYGLYSAPVVVSPGAVFDMRGGTIEKNENYRSGYSMCLGAGAVLIYSWQETDVSGKMILSGDAVIRNNTVHYMDGGAISLLGDAELTMNGGTISGNKDLNGRGGGICVAGPTSQMLSDKYYNPRCVFTMEGGEISGNEAIYGGGIYVNSNYVTLNAGKILDNKAHSVGGGIYVETPRNGSTATHLKNAVITGNHAYTMGGGMYFCPTGTGSLYVNDGSAIFDNRSDGAGDDFVSVVVGVFGEGAKKAILAERILGGGLANWFRDGSVYGSALSNNWGAVNNAVPRYDENSPLFSAGTYNDRSLALKAILSGGAKELALANGTLFIMGNTASYGGGVGSNGSATAGDSTVKDWTVQVNKTWDPSIPKESRKPVQVQLVVKHGDKEYTLETVELSEDNNWQYTFTGLPASVKGNVSVKEIISKDDGYYADYLVNNDAGTNLVSIAVTNIAYGTLNIHKNVVGGGDAAANKEYSFHVTGNNGYDQIVTVKGNGTVSLNDLKAGTYLVKEVMEGTDLKGYSLVVTVDNQGNLVVVPGGEYTINVTNNYEHLPSGSLTVVKNVIGGGTAAAEKVYTFSITGPDGYQNTVTITGNGRVTLEDLTPGDYTVTEDDAQLGGYIWTVSGNGLTVTVRDVLGGVATITNTYSTGGGGSTPDPDPEEPPVDVPDPDVPLVPGPDPEEPPVDIPDPDVPLTPEPPEVDVPDPAVPLAPRPTKPAKPQTSVPTVTEIPDQAVPLADVPNTGDDSALWLSVALAAAAGIVCVKLLEKKKVK